MAKSNLNFDKIKKYLFEKDPKLKRIILDKNCIFFFDQTKFSNLTLSLHICESIVGQQLSVKSAKSIWKKIYLKNNKNTLKTISKFSINDYKKIGLSRSKISFIQDIARNTLNKKINFNKYYYMADDQIIEDLIKIRGIGSWTAEMFLIFSMRRINVFSKKDNGLISAIKKLYKINNLNENRLNLIIKRWEPYKSIVSIYLWRALDSKII